MKIFPSERAQWIRLGIFLGLPLFAGLAFALWTPGEKVTDGRHDRGKNGVFMGHGWLTSGNEFLNKPEGMPQYQHFHDTRSIEQTLDALRERNMLWLFPHLCPCKPDGSLPEYANASTQSFAYIAQARGQHVLPWIGGVNGTTVAMNDPKWRQTFCKSVENLLQQNTLLAGVIVNIEPWPSGDANGLLLLDELKAAMPEGKTLAVAAYPPPTLFQRSTEVHWNEAYFRAVAKRCQLMVPMLYDTGLPVAKLYTHLIQQWSEECIVWAAPTPVLLAIPAYDEAKPWHKPKVETPANALRGIHAALDANGTPLPPHFSGIAWYADFSATDTHWRTWKDEYQNSTLPVPKAEKVPSPLDAMMGR